MKFINPQNNHIEEKSYPWLWVLFFGAFYFLASGVWIHFLIMLILSVACWFTQGPPGTLLVVLLNLIYAALAQSVIRSHYLHKGWAEVGATAPAPQQPSQELAEKQCPFCAESIKKAAVICKHCGRDQPLPPTAKAGSGVDMPPFMG